MFTMFYLIEVCKLFSNLRNADCLPITLEKCKMQLLHSSYIYFCVNKIQK